jgi:hypothetical protein
MISLVAELFILVMTLDNRRVEINPREIVSLIQPETKRMMSENVHCIIALTDGKVVSVVEDCAHLKARLESLR